MENLTIVKAFPKDIETIFELGKEVFVVDSWPIEWFIEGINDPDGYYFLAYINNTLAGFCGMYNITAKTPNYCKIATLGVKKQYRNKGLGKMLLLKMLETAQMLGLKSTKLEVNTNNPAIKLYQSLGFVIEEKKEKYFDKSGDDAYIMWRQ